MPTVYLALGSNLGDRLGFLRAAVAALDQPAIGAVDPKGGIAPVYETRPVGGPPGQGRFLNSAVRLQTTLSPRQLLDAVFAVESALGRERRERWGPRVIDIDILLYDDRVIDEPGLTVPHPRMAERLFVLAPLADIAGDVVHPTAQRTIRALRNAAAGTDPAALVSPVGNANWWQPP